MWCRAFRGTHITPPVLRAMRIREVAILFDADVGPARPTLIIPDHVAAPRRPGGVVLREVDY